MDGVLAILGQYYIILIVISVILLFALIGYFIDKKHPMDEGKLHTVKVGDNDSAKELKEQISAKGDVSINSVMNKTVISSSEPVESLDSIPPVK